MVTTRHYPSQRCPILENTTLPMSLVFTLYNGYPRINQTIMKPKNIAPTPPARNTVGEMLNACRIIRCIPSGNRAYNTHSTTNSKPIALNKSFITEERSARGKRRKLYYSTNPVAVPKNRKKSLSGERTIVVFVSTKFFSYSAKDL